MARSLPRAAAAPAPDMPEGAGAAASTWLQPRDYAPDLAEQLRTVGIRRTWRDDLADLWFACRAQPWLAVTVFASGLLVGAAAVLLPALAIAWVRL